VLARLQRGLEQLYRVDTQVAVEDFLIDADAREAFGPVRHPREQLLVSQRDDELELALFVDRDVLANLERHDPVDGLDHRNLDDFLLTVEGVSHFVYLVWRARADRAVSALELELQAEVDKYVTTLLTMESAGRVPAELARQLFGDVEFADDLDDEESVRYRVANENAHRYSESLHRRYVQSRRIDGMLRELRRFYRLTLADKLAWIRDTMAA
jgi:hypothetical protein